MNNPDIRLRTHTGCHYYKKGRNKAVRREFHRKVRHRHKQELKNRGDIINVNLSIGYTD